MKTANDHGGGIDAACAEYGGERREWLDLSTGINPAPYPVPDLPPGSWNALPDAAATKALTEAARRFWNVPDQAAILAAPGASALIARIPYLSEKGRVRIEKITYNEHRSAFVAAGWALSDTNPDARVIVSPNNPTGDYWDGCDPASLTVIDESFCDLEPTRSHIAASAESGTLILKSFGKFWGLAGMRLGFAIGDPVLVARLAGMLGPWPVSGPALKIGAMALSDPDWTDATRKRLAADAARLDRLMTGKGAEIAGGTDLFRLYRVGNAAEWQEQLAKHRILGRIFPYSTTYLRLGLPTANGWPRLEAAL